MRTIFKGKKYEVLSMDGLRFETNFDHIYNTDKNSHVPIFELEKELFVQVGTGVRKFIPKLIRYAFRYYDNEDNLSEPLTAVICELEGEDGDCVILGKYAQSAADDYWDSLSPYSDMPTGRWDFWSEVPDIFFSDRDRNKGKPYYLRRVETPGGNYQYKDGDNYICGYRYNPDKNDIEIIPIEIQELYYEPDGHKIIHAREIDEGKAFWNSIDCFLWCKQNYIVL